MCLNYFSFQKQLTFIWLGWFLGYSNQQNHWWWNESSDHQLRNTLREQNMKPEWSSSTPFQCNKIKTSNKYFQHTFSFWWKRYIYTCWSFWWNAVAALEMQKRGCGPRNAKTRLQLSKCKNVVAALEIQKRGCGPRNALFLAMVTLVLKFPFLKHLLCRK